MNPSCARTITIAASLLTALFVWFGVQPAALAVSTSVSDAKDGILDLNRWSPRQDGAVILEGPREFYWNRLLDPQRLKQRVS